jgi:hypothetical protein
LEKIILLPFESGEYQQAQAAVKKAATVKAATKPITAIKTTETTKKTTATVKKSAPVTATTAKALEIVVTPIAAPVKSTEPAKKTASIKEVKEAAPTPVKAKTPIAPEGVKVTLNAVPSWPFPVGRFF